MKTRIIKIDCEKYLPHQINSIVSLLKKDGLIVYPTETFYGLGANSFSVEAVKKVFILKGRARAKPLPVVISDRAMLKSVASIIPPVAEPFLELFWPGPLTLIFPANALLPRDFMGDAKSVGVRLPDHPGLRDLIKGAGFPITATSANLSGEEELSDPQKVFDIFAGKVDCIVDGGRTRGGLPSTVIDLTSPRPKILREGAIPLSELQKAYKDISISS